MEANAIPGLAREKVKITFRLLASGAEVSFGALLAHDDATRDALRAQALRWESASRKEEVLARLFPKEQAVIDRMNEQGASITIQPQPGGFSISFSASDQPSRTAIHEFILTARGNRVLSREERILNHPGNNLGWDARKDPDVKK